MEETKLKQVRERLQEKYSELDSGMTQEEWEFRRDYLSRWAEKNPDDLDEEGKQKLRELNKKYRQFLINEPKRKRITKLLENIEETFGNDLDKSDLENRLLLLNGKKKGAERYALPLQSPELFYVLDESGYDSQKGQSLDKTLKRSMKYQEIENFFYDALEKIANKIVTGDQIANLYTSRECVDLGEIQQRLVKQWRDFRSIYLKDTRGHEKISLGHDYKAELTEEGWETYKEQYLNPEKENRN